MEWALAFGEGVKLVSFFNTEVGLGGRLLALILSTVSWCVGVQVGAGYRDRPFLLVGLARSHTDGCLHSRFQYKLLQNDELETARLRLAFQTGRCASFSDIRALRFSDGVGACVW